MRYLFILIAMLVFCCTGFAAYSTLDITELIHDELLLTEAVNDALSAIGFCDTLFLSIEEIMTEPARICIMLNGWKSLIRHPSSHPISLDRAIIGGYPINTITVMDSAYIEGFDIYNTSGTGCGIWGLAFVSVEDCIFGDVEIAVSSLDNSQVEIRRCRFSGTGLPVSVNGAEYVVFKDNVVDSLAGRVEIENTSKVFVCGNQFIADIPNALMIDNFDSLDVVKNLFIGNSADASSNGACIGGAGTMLFRNNTVVDFHNSLYVEDGAIVNAEIYSNVFSGAQCGVCAGSNMLAPWVFSHNHYDLVMWGDPTWNVGNIGGGDGGEEITDGDPLFESNHGLGSGSPGSDNDREGNDRGFDGGDTLWWSGTITLEMPDPELEVNSSSISAGPNPFNSFLRIEFEDITQLDIYDLHGRSVLSEDVSGKRSIAWNSYTLPSGTYFIRGSGPNGVIKKQVQLVK